LIDEQKQTSESHYSSIITFSMLLKTGQKQPTPVQPSTRDDMMGIIYTSGTTGNPKGVLLTHGNLLSNITVVPHIIQVSEVDRSLSFLPWAHIFGQMAELHLIIYVGCSTAFAENVNSIIQNLSEVRPTFMVAVPRIFNRIYDSIQSQMRDKPFPVRMLFNTALDLAKKKNKKMHLTTKEMLLLKAADKILFKVIRDKFGGRLRFAVSGASSLSTEVAEFIDALNILILEGYGLSETSPLVTVNTFTQRKIGSVGKVISGVRVKIDKTVLGDSVADCEEGEVIVYGPNIMKGYHKLDQETAAVMTADKGFRTGDLGRIDKDGFLFITGRIKEQYKLENGKYVSPGHIEEKLKLSPYISNAFIYGTNKAHNIALLGVNMDELHKFAKANKINIRGKSLLQVPQVKDLYESELLKYEKAFKSYERPHGFALVEDDWSPDNGMLTPSMKLKRRHVYGRYKQTIENLYQ
jgi:long-chain acyl-CoA synthetase